LIIRRGYYILKKSIGTLYRELIEAQVATEAEKYDGNIKKISNTMISNSLK
jgi:hypothetical protein